jgi:hypothetical protein
MFDRNTRLWSINKMEPLFLQTRSGSGARDRRLVSAAYSAPDSRALMKRSLIDSLWSINKMQSLFLQTRSGGG